MSTATALSFIYIAVDNCTASPGFQRQGTVAAIDRLSPGPRFLPSVIDHVAEVFAIEKKDVDVAVYDISQYNIPLSNTPVVPAVLPAPLPLWLPLEKSISDATHPDSTHLYIRFSPKLPFVIAPSPPPLLEEFFQKSQFANKAPSTIAKSPSTLQTSSDQRIWNDRPESETNIAPASLLYPPVGIFFDILEGRRVDDVDSIQEDLLQSAVARFATVGRQYHDNEAEQRRLMLPLLNEILASHTHSKRWNKITQSMVGSIPNVASDGQCDGAIGAINQLVVTVGFKKALMNITSEAECEAVAYVIQSHSLGYEAHSEIYMANRMPTLMLTIQGPYINFYVVLMLQRPRLVELTPMLGLRHDGADLRAIDHLCTAFRAACVLLDRIHVDTSKWLGQPKDSFTRLEHPEWPAITSASKYPTEDKSSVLRFKLPAKFQAASNRLLFTAKLESDAESGETEVLVKFSKSYCPELHHFCSQLGHAPQLLGYQSLPGGWHVTVSQFCWNTHSLALMTLSEADRKRAHQELSALTRKFHRAGWVHGDLRTANILAPEGWQQDVSARLLLVDFDWGGRVTEARFPTALLNPELCVREFKTFNDLFIRFEDDVKVLAATLGLNGGDEVTM